MTGPTSRFIYTRKGGAGSLVGPDGEPVSSEKKPEPTAPTVSCGYCPKVSRKMLVKFADGRRRYQLPPGWVRLPNGVHRCPACKLVPEIGTGKLVRPGRIS